MSTEVLKYSVTTRSTTRPLGRRREREARMGCIIHPPSRERFASAPSLSPMVEKSSEESRRVCVPRTREAQGRPIRRITEFSGASTRGRAAGPLVIPSVPLLHVCDFQTPLGLYRPRTARLRWALVPSGWGLRDLPTLAPLNPHAMSLEDAFAPYRLAPGAPPEEAARAAEALAATPLLAAPAEPLPAPMVNRALADPRRAAPPPRPRPAAAPTARPRGPGRAARLPVVRAPARPGGRGRSGRPGGGLRRRVPRPAGRGPPRPARGRLLPRVPARAGAVPGAGVRRPLPAPRLPRRWPARRWPSPPARSRWTSSPSAATTGGSAPRRSRRRCAPAPAPSTTRRARAAGASR